VAESIWRRYASRMPRKKSSKPKSNVSEKTRASDDALRRELANADPKKFDRLVSPLFRSSSEEPKAKKNEAANLAKISR
jgi:hypothetical protein